MTKRMNVQISKAESGGNYWLESIDNAEICAFVQRVGGWVLKTHKTVVYINHASGTVYTVCHSLEAPAAKWISRTYQEVTEEATILCPYHRDSLTWDACTEGFEGCQIETARKEGK